MPLRFGILGAGRIAPKALIAPAEGNPGARIQAIGARDPKRARDFADEHGIPLASGYRQVIESPDVDAIYVALPNGLHGPWTRAALEAGKHVLCEKPLASNADEARGLFDLAEERGLLLMEAIHYPFHPVAAHLRARCRGGGELETLGRLETLEAIFTAPIPESDIRFDLQLAGGATMDLGSYTLHVLRMAAGAEPREVRATAELGPAGIDAAMEAELSFDGGTRGRMRVGMGRGRPFETVFRARGSAATLEITRFQVPMIGHEITWHPHGGEAETTSLTTRSTFDFQLEAFLALAAGGPPFEPAFGGRTDALANMELIDRVYRAAGLEPRPISEP